VTGNGPHTDRLRGAILTRDNAGGPPTQVLAAWRQRLRDEIARAQLVFELADTDVDIEGLEAEVALFKRVCACLAWEGET
jgi:hypothetical protein